jgi:hypothetical protein
MINVAIHHFRHSGGGASSSDFNDRAVMQFDVYCFLVSGVYRLHKARGVVLPPLSY